MRTILLLACLSCSTVALADKPLLLVTPAGVWESQVKDGIPGPWKPAPYDVIVQGFTGGTPPEPPTPPVPPTTDPVVAEVALISRQLLRDKADATAAAAIVQALAGQQLTENKFVEALTRTAPIVDASLKMQGRFVTWTDKILAVTSDPTVIRAGLITGFRLDAETITAIAASAEAGGAPLAEKALGFAEIIALIQMILEVLRNLGILS